MGGPRPAILNRRVKCWLTEDRQYLSSIMFLSTTEGDPQAVPKAVSICKNEKSLGPWENRRGCSLLEVRLNTGLAVHCLRAVNYGVTEDRLSGETLRVGVLFADSEAGRKKVPGVSVLGVSPWFRSCRIWRSKALPSSRV